MFSTIHYVKGEENLDIYPDFDKLKARCSDDGLFCLWYKGCGKLSILNLSTSKFSEMEGFFTFFNRGGKQTAFPVALAISADGDSVYALSKMANEVDPYRLHICRKEGEINIYLMNDLFKGPITWNCIELSFENDIVFVAGEEFLSRKAYLVAISTKKAEGLELSNFQKWDSDTGYDGVKVLKRHQDCNVFFLGMVRHIVIYYWIDEKFVFLNQVPLNCQYPISDLCFSRNRLWVASNSLAIHSIHFDENDFKSMEYNKKLTPSAKQKIDPDRYLADDENAPLIPKSERDSKYPGLINLGDSSNSAHFKIIEPEEETKEGGPGAREEHLTSTQRRRTSRNTRGGRPLNKR